MTPAVREAVKVEGATRNQYFRLDHGRAAPIDVLDPPTLGWGQDYLVDILGYLERKSTICGRVFYISFGVPEALPSYGPEVVLVIGGDEAFRHRAYFADVGAIIRTYGSQPAYYDGIPSSHVRLSQFLQHVYKIVSWLLSLAASVLKSGRFGYAGVRRRTLRIPPGCYARFEPEVRPMSSRPFEYGFLGSLSFGGTNRKLVHRLVSPPKIAARAAMMAALDAMPAALRARRIIFTTVDFEDSIKLQDQYVRALENCKVSLCPRGTNLDTYRFFESCKAGCVVVCETLPRTWYYENHPGIVIGDWRDLPRLMASLLADEAGLAARSQAARTYWATVASEQAVARRIAEFLNRLAP